MAYKSDQLFGIINAVRKRRSLLLTLRGLAITLAVAAALLLLTGFAAYRYRYSAGTLITLRVVAVLGLIATVYFLFVRPLRRKISDAQIARLVEEKHPGLEDRFVSAVEFSGDQQQPGSTVIVERLMDDADRHANQVNLDEVIPNKRFWQFGGAALASVLLFASAIIFGPRELKSGLAQAFAPASPVAASNALQINIKPGTARVPKGSDQKLIASLVNFNADQATVFTRKAGASEDQWVGQPMEPTKNQNEFQHFIFNIQDDTEYFVESSGCRSGVFKLTVVDLPYVKQVDQTQFFPSYTGLAPKTIEDAPDVAVLAGTTVKLSAKLTGRAKSARLVFRDGKKIEMENTGDATFAATLTVTENNSYHIELTSVDGDVYNGSNEYDISVLDDRPPVVTFEKPGRDTKATSIEEILTLAKAEDDYGVLLLDLYYSVNGGEEKKVDLQKLRGESAKVLSGAHTFFLEEFSLQPGDLVSYYAKARDAKNETTSDIYFIEVKPFEKEFKQSQQNGGGEGGGEQQEGLTKRQREIIAATFKVNREEPTYNDKDKAENYDTVALAQEKLREDALALVERIKRRLGPQINQQPQFQKIVEHITQASKEMEPAAKELRGRKGKDAMPYEQKALQQLQRADAIFREVTIAMSQESQGQGQQQAEELADLFELELDKMKNQYETLNREKKQQAAQQDDEAKRKLEELSRRMQKQLEEQQQKMRQSPRNQSGGGGGRQQQQMMEEARKAARELEKLSRERRDPQLQELANKMNQAADEMQKAQNAAANNKEDEAVSRNARALQQMEEAQRKLSQLQRQQGGQSIQDLKQRAANAAARQQEISKETEDLARQARGIQQGGQSPQSLNESKQQLAEKKENLANEVGGLERDIDQAARSLGQEQQNAANKMREASRTLRENRVADGIRYTKQLNNMNAYDQARAYERNTQQKLDEVAQQLTDAEKSSKQKGGGGDETEQSLDRARQLADGQLTLFEQTQDAQARRVDQDAQGVGQAGEGGDHGLNTRS